MATRMARFGVKPEFDREQDFVVMRGFTCAGVSYAPGQKFDKTTTTVRRLRQLYDLNSLKMQPPEVAKVPERKRLSKRVSA